MYVRLTKFVHACLLVEAESGTVLIDPGQMSHESGLFKVADLSRLDAIAITHEHFDHFSPTFVHELCQKFPEVPIISTPAVRQALTEANIKTGNTSPLIEATSIQHENMEPLSGGFTADNIAVNVLNILTHPGDSLQSTLSKSIFAMPLAGPWGSAIAGIRLAEALRPRFVVPIHDWMWNDAWRKDMYERCKVYFAGKNIEFLMPVDGEAIDIKL
ncbi:MAG: MBL fold metallo-hydrolase [bacterium]|nr:MBL fold metallo-hydrolase [bacterium]